MALYGEETKAFELCPAEPEKGLPGVVLEITEKQKTQGERNIVKWLWKFEVSEPVREDGEPFYLYLETYRSGPFVREIADNLHGEKISDEEWPRFDVQQFEGTECRLYTEHNTANNGRTYCNINKVDSLFGDPFNDQ